MMKPFGLAEHRTSFRLGANRVMAEGCVVGGERQGKSHQILCAVVATRQFTHALQRGDCHCNQHTNDGDHDQQFNEREGRAVLRAKGLFVIHEMGSASVCE